MARERHPVREIPCANCGNIFGQTKYEMSRKLMNCPPCALLHRSTRNPLTKVKTKVVRRSRHEIVLPQSRKPHFDKAKGEWCLRVRIRRRGSKEAFETDRVYLGLGKDAPMAQVEAVYTTTYARMELNGASRHTAEKIHKKRKRIKDIKHRVTSWKCGRDRDLGIARLVVPTVWYTVHLPDPFIDGKKHLVGRFKTRAEARDARNAFYKTLQFQLVPCAVCGMMPTVRRSHVTHFSADCPNRVQMPTGIRPLLQTRLWNLVYSHGTVKAGKIAQADLYAMGFLRQAHKGFRFYPRTDVEQDFSLAKNYARELPKPTVGGDPEFE